MSYIGVYGLSVMGQSIALNIANKNYSVSVYNKFSYNDTTKAFVDNRCKGLDVSGYEQLTDFIKSLDKPRRILLMVTAGKVVDDIIEELVHIVEPGDIILDCGNSYYKDTIRRESMLIKKKIYFFGVGISGGEKGALKAFSQKENMCMTNTMTGIYVQTIKH